jgi:biopolymer transport protein ExbD
MRLRKARRTYGCEINMAPMIDIVFQLIIFFMIATQFVRMEVEELTLPEARTTRAKQEMAGGTLIVNVCQDGRTVVGGQDQSDDTLQVLLADARKDRPVEEVSVLVRGDRSAPWKSVAAVLRACASCGIAQVRVAALEPQAQEGSE